jgi:hypothetical protein
MLWAARCVAVMKGQPFPRAYGTSLARLAANVGIRLEPCPKCDRRVDGWRRWLVWRWVHRATCATDREQRAAVHDVLRCPRPRGPAFGVRGREDVDTVVLEDWGGGG